MAVGLGLLTLGLMGACGGRSNLDGGDVLDADGNGAEPTSGRSNGSNGNNGNNGNTSSGGGDNGGTSSNAGSNSSSGTGNTSGGLDPGGGVVEPEPDPGNPNCTPNNAKGGQACTAPCVTTCGFHGMGTKGCDCVSGVFVSCHCPRPWNYQGATTAPPCATTDGRTHWIDNTACSEEWAQCIGSDPVSGTNPRGCVCLTDPVNGQLEWTCGSTNKWFLSQ
jgi:hypothetical protein